MDMLLHLSWQTLSFQRWGFTFASPIDAVCSVKGCQDRRISVDALKGKHFHPGCRQAVDDAVAVPEPCKCGRHRLQSACSSALHIFQKIGPNPPPITHASSGIIQSGHSHKGRFPKYYVVVSSSQGRQLWQDFCLELGLSASSRGEGALPAVHK